MGIVAGIDFGTQSVRVTVFDRRQGRLGSAAAEVPVYRQSSDPDYAAQRHADHLAALQCAMHEAIGKAGVEGGRIDALGLAATGSTVAPVGDGLEPLDDYYLWCDHRASAEAERFTRVARESGLEALEWCGGACSAEWGWPKLLHWLRHNPGKRDRMVTMVEHGDLAVATLCGIGDAKSLPRSVCSMGSKWLWNRRLGGMPPEEFLVRVDPLLRGMRRKLDGRYATSDRIAGQLCEEWAGKLGLRPGIPIPVSGLDGHWDTVGAGIREGDVVNVVGTSAAIMAITPHADLIPGFCGVVEGSVHPDFTCVEAGLSAAGDIFEAIAGRAGTSVDKLSAGLEEYRAGQTGLLRLTWDNGDRTVLVNADLGGITFGWNLSHTARDELFAAIEGVALHTRIILDRMAKHGVPIRRLINSGGIPPKNQTLNRVFANATSKPVLVSDGETRCLGALIFAFLAAGEFSSIEEAQDTVCPGYRTVQPDPGEAQVYGKLYSVFRKLYFGFGEKDAAPVALGDVLQKLRGRRPPA